jgi:Alpha/beta hydrolase family
MKGGRSGAILITCQLLAGCASLHLTQNPGDMLVRTGSTDVTLPAAPFADLFLDYALLADQAYQNEVYKTGAPFLADRTYCHPVGRPSCVDLTPRARTILSQWRLVFASTDPRNFPCKPGRTPCTQPVGGLGVQIWVRQGASCSEAVLSFRGTDRGSSDDWTSNLHWVLRLLPFYDQYEQVQDYAPDFVQAIEKEPCFVKETTQIVAVGHSLGGGLAQQAAYMDPNIRHVYAFDPSVVTGSSDTHVRQVWDQNVPGLKIERVYEHGEFLAYLRFVQRQLAPPSACNPQIRSVRFQALRGSVTKQHKLSALVTGLLHSSATTPAQTKRQDLPTPGAADCPSPPSGSGQPTRA